MPANRSGLRLPVTTGHFSEGLDPVSGLQNLAGEVPGFGGEMVEYPYDLIDRWDIRGVATGELSVDEASPIFGVCDSLFGVCGSREKLEGRHQCAHGRARKSIAWNHGRTALEIGVELPHASLDDGSHRLLRQ